MMISPKPVLEIFINPQIIFDWLAG